MISLNVDELILEQLFEKEGEEGKVVYIYFVIHGFSYCMAVTRSEKGVFSPTHISHHGWKEGNCSFCDHNYTFCDSLDDILFPLFHRLIQTNSLRLSWLYRNYRA